MRICVIGNSATAGVGLPDQSLAWPWLAASQLSAAIGEPVDVRHILFAPMGGRAAGFALSKVEETDPDIVVIAVGSYVCAIGTVAERVRQRFGERAYRAFRRTELWFESRTGNRRDTFGRLNRAGRWLSRRVIGTATITTIDDVVNVFSELLRLLAQREGLHVVALAEPQWPKRIARENPGSAEALDTVMKRVHVAVDRHRFLWADSGPSYDAAPDREALYLPDGVHKTVEGLRIQANLVVQALIGHGGPYADRVQAAPAS
ncbi:MAG: hypothetical protein HY875_08560 [Chloroflexi bacterium]|nr:hypothetical protein [Chloroflexota bacterium]